MKLPTVLVATAITLAGSLAEAQQAAETLPFFRPDGVFDSSGVDNINLFNGDTGVAIPLGPAYTLGPTGYQWQLTAHASAKFWHMSTCTTNGSKYAYLSGDPTLGVGWTLQMGYVIHRTPPNHLFDAWYYYTPDGGSHRVQLVSGVGITTDGSHLRIKSTTSPAGYTVEFPDGSVQAFAKLLSNPTGSSALKDFSEFDYGETPVSRYGLSQIKDRFGNILLTVDYLSSDTSWKVSTVHLTPLGKDITFTWTTRSLGGTTWDVLLSVAQPAPGAQTLTAGFTYVDGIFPRNTYDGSDTTACNGNVSPVNTSVPELATVTLTDGSIKMQDVKYKFTYWAAPQGGVQAQGALNTLTLPSLGVITYAYAQTKGNTPPCNTDNSCDPETAVVVTADEVADAGHDPAYFEFISQLDHSPAVSSRKQTDPFTGRTDETTYTRLTVVHTSGCPVPCTYDIDNVTRRVTVVEPSNDTGTPAKVARRHFFHVSLGDGNFDDDDSGIELDRRYYKDDSLAVTVRTQISCYEGKCGYRDDNGDLQSYGANDRRPPESEITWFGIVPATNGQDGGLCPDTVATTKCIWVQNFPGGNNPYNAVAGKYQQTMMTSNLGTGVSPVSRTTLTTWSAAANDAKWYLDKYDHKLVFDGTDNLESDGITSLRSYAEFDTATGFLSATWTWDSLLNKKLAHCFYKDSAGQTVNELTKTYPEGTPSANPCVPFVAPPIDGDAFGLAHTWGTDKLLSTTKWKDSASSISWKRFDVTRDAGFVTQSRDTSGLVTAFTYDALGRLIQIQPPGGEWPTTFCYLPGNVDGAGTTFTPFVIVKKTGATTLTGVGFNAPAGTSCARDDGDPAGASVTGTVLGYNYDGFGRLVREIRRMDRFVPGNPGPPATLDTSAFALREYRYDSAGHRRSASDWRLCTVDTQAGLAGTSISNCALPAAVTPSATPPNSSLFSSFDPFGRAQTVTGPNGSSSTSISRADGIIQFSDTKEQVSVSNVNGTCSGSSCTGGSTAVTTTLKDALGRAYSVTDPGNLASGYTYGVQDKLTAVSQASGTSTQTRTYNYSAYGFLTSELSPERVAGGFDGTTSYRSYGSLGNLLTKSEAGVNYKYSYDAAGRLTCVYTGAACGGSPYAAGTYVVNCYDGTGRCADGNSATSTPNYAGTNAAGRLSRRIGWNQIPYQAAPVVDDFDYDSGGRQSGKKTEIGWPIGAPAPPNTQSPSFPTATGQTWSYNTLGLPSLHVHPSTSSFAVAYDKYHGGLLSNASATWTNNAQQVVANQYLPAGLLDFYQLGGSTVKVTTVPDSQIPSRVKSIASTGIAGHDLAAATYVYDGAGNIVKIGTDAFTYDTRSRLTKADYGSPNIQNYAYDTFGNIKTKAGAPLCAGDCVNNHMDAAAYDGHGNVTLVGSDQLFYDDLSRLIETRNVTSDVLYLYDGAGERLAAFSYAPGITRQEYAHDIVEARGDTIPASCSSTFVDVICGSDADAKYIRDLQLDGITSGCSTTPLKFCPYTTISRGEAATFLVRSKYCTGHGTGCTYTPPHCTGIFSDVPCPPTPQAPFGDYIEVLANDHVTAGCGGTQFCPDLALKTWEAIAWLGIGYYPGYRPLPRGSIITYRDEANHVITEAASGFQATQANTVVKRDNVFQASQLVGSQIWGGGFNSYVTDHLGTPRVTSTSAGVWLESKKYWPFGDEFSSAGNADQRLKFAGMERDLEAAHYYDHARIHDFATGRFTSTDTVEGAATDSQTWNRFAYSRNNPVRLQDSNGKVFVLSGSTAQQRAAEGIVNSGLVGVRFAIAPDGTASLTQTDVQGPPAEGQAALADTLGAVINDPAVTTIGLVSGATNVFVGSYDLSMVDLSDLAAFPTAAGPLSEASAFGHEAAEQYAKQVFGVTPFIAAHAVGISAEDRIAGAKRGGDSPVRDASGALIRVVATYTVNGKVVTATIFVKNGNVVGVKVKP